MPAEWKTSAPTPMIATPTPKMSIAPSIPVRAPKRASTTELTDRPMIEAMPPTRSMSPSWPRSTPTASLMAGTREAQVEMLSPLARKIAKIAVRQRTS